MNSISSARSRLALLELDAGVQVLGVLADDHQVDRSLVKNVRTPVYCLQGRMQANRPSAWRRWTLMLRKPVPTGVVIGALMRDAGAADALHHARRAAACRAVAMTSTPASCTSQLILTPVASSTRRAPRPVRGRCRRR